MKGHIRERSPGHWAIVIDAVDSRGERKRRWHSFHGTKRQVQTECARLIAQRQEGGAVDPSREIVSAFFNRWLEHIATQVSPRTLERYAEIARMNLGPLIGSEPLAKLQPARISRAYAQALASGRRDGKGGLSPRTVTHMHRVLREALQQAVRWRLIASNPADAVRPPKVERKEMKALDADGTVELIEAARGTNLFALVLLCVMTGVRRGEAAALRWRNVDLDRAQLSVVASVEQMDKGGVREKETKSGKHRSIALSPIVVDELRRHRVKQAEGLAQARCQTDRRPSRRCSRGRRAAATAIAKPDVPEVPSRPEPQGGPAARSSSQSRDRHAKGGGAPQGSTGEARSFERQRGHRSLQPRDAGHAGRRGQPR